MAQSPMELFAGGEIECFTMLSGSAATGASAGQYDPAFSACALLLQSRTYWQSFKDDDGAAADVSAGDTLFGLWRFNPTVASSGGPILTVNDNTGRAALRIFKVANGAYQVAHNTGTAASPVWATLITFESLASYANFSLAHESPFVVRLFSDGSEVGMAEFINPNISSLSSFTLGPMSNSAHISQIGFNRNLSNIGGRIWTRKAEAAGALSEMEGVYTALNKTEINDTTAVVSNAAGQTSTFAYQNISDLTGLVAGGVHVWTRAKNDGTAPENLKAVCRVGSANYLSPDMDISGGFGSLLARFPVNPATSAAWVTTSFNDAQIGLQSAT